MKMKYKLNIQLSYNDGIRKTDNSANNARVDEIYKG